MSSWVPAAYPPPPPPGSSRHSPSRSPSTFRAPPGGAYPPPPVRPEPPYAGDAYRADWEAYDRDRAWAEYERDRAAYEYSRRGRSRSPGLDEAGRKRRRSPSPYDRGRFEPRPRYGDDYDAHSRAYGNYSPRGQYPPPPYGSSRRAPPDPHTFDYPASLKQFAEWFRYYYPQEAIEEDNADKAAEQSAGDGSKPRNGIRARWEKYKKDFANAQLQRMFEHHKKSPWFAEKYDPSPDYDNMRKRVRKEGWRGRIAAFTANLETGQFDPELKEPESEPSAAFPVKENATAANGGSTPAADGQNAGTAPAGEETKQEETEVQLEAENEGGDHDMGMGEANGKPSFDPKKQTRGEEISVQPEGNQVMIRTIPPDIGRIKLEEACGKISGFVYLALGDPLQKRNFYRAGWLKFREDADMALVMGELADKKIEGFKLHVTHNTKPFTSRVRYAPEVSNKPDRLEKDLVNVKALAANLEDEYFYLRRWQPPKKEKSATEGENAEANGDQHQQDAPMEGVEDSTDPEPERGSEAVERRIEKVMSDLQEQGLVDPNDEKAYMSKKTVVSLDLYLAYLRSAFHTCYYCAVVTDHIEELQRKCIKHVRKPLSKLLLEEIKAAEAEKAEREKKEAVKDEENEEDKDKEAKEKPTENRDWKRNDERWLEWLDSKVALLINRNGVDPRDYGGKSYEEELSKLAEPHIKQEEEGKFRCKTCNKLFKATSFVEKHIVNKHPEHVGPLDQLPYYNNFALDPHRIQPFSHPPPPAGNAQAPPPQAYGLAAPAPYPPGHGDYGRVTGYYAGYYPPPYANGAYWDPYAYPYAAAAAAAVPPYPPRRDEATTARRLSDRISGYAYEHTPEIAIPAAAGLPAKPVATLEPGPGGRRGGRGGSVSGPPPPPPPDAKEDPRAAAGRKVSYHDMDLVAEGDVELTY